ncbi:hypothetical protein KV102_05550 [Mumia sp. zg.B53]|uniref:hypothetical protein n=1 Tax=unclassified Mumia TaxID=2621872 RepID=UPI001C6E4B3E|nr:MULTISPECIES: hypothetical protein [unclassified Mumia]MBW9204317.1 hypothetical protein [Mumia sp. zg.B17]MBW9209698.1 hypothetical protein [Mumia sp. zg.B21]MBW9214302.1 hypothetical protein [Mumia sp. zg.B53]MDD9348021.1 hypothetical protein [Mumia sp.]
MTPFVAPRPRQPLVVGPAIVAPLLLVLSGLLRVVDGLDGSYGGAVREVGLAMLLFAFVLLGLVAIGLARVLAGRRSPVPSGLRTAALVSGTSGAAASAWTVLGHLYPAIADVTPPAVPVGVVGPGLLGLGAVGMLVLLTAVPRGGQDARTEPGVRYALAYERTDHTRLVAPPLGGVSCTSQTPPPRPCLVSPSADEP